MAARHQFKEKLPKYHLVQDFLKDESPKSLIDFGCAHGAMISRIKNDFPDILIVDGYDPGVIEYEKFPQQQYDCLVSNDVIEHIEPEYLDSTLIAMSKLFTKSAWLIIAALSWILSISKTSVALLRAKLALSSAPDNLLSARILA